MLIIGSGMLLLASYLVQTAFTAPSESFSFGSLLAYLIPLLAGGLCLTMALTSKVCLSAAGVDFYMLGLHAMTAWDNIIALGSPTQGPANVPVFRLRHPATIVWVWHPAGYREKVLQLPLNGYNLDCKRPLYQTIQRYCPRVITNT